MEREDWDDSYHFIEELLNPTVGHSPSLSYDGPQGFNMSSSTSCHPLIYSSFLLPAHHLILVFINRW
jgi:hypothetical protein